MKQLKITVMLGGPSVEREVSLRTGAAVTKALRSLGHSVVELDPRTPDRELASGTEVVFLALHGTYGEDGTVQRRLEELGVPYTGCGPEASRIVFDKVLTKELLVAAGVPTARYALIESAGAAWPTGWQAPLVLKPARQGSSVGVEFVERQEDWSRALGETFKYDSKALIEEKIVGRETTVGILEGAPLPVVEVRPKRGTYDYRNKYTPGNTEYLLPGGVRLQDDQGDSAGGDGRLPRHRRTGLFPSGCHGDRRRETAGSGGQYVAGDDRDQPAAQGRGRGRPHLRPALSGDDRAGAGPRLRRLLLALNEKEPTP